MKTKIKKEIYLLNFYIDYSIRLYRMAKENRELSNLNDNMFLDVELYTDKIIGYAYDAKEGLFKRKKEAISYLDNISIYNLANVISWMQEEESIKNNPNYYQYILLVENIRILALKLFKKSKELGIIKIDISEYKSQFKV